jgi:hypothetical protein
MEKLEQLRGLARGRDIQSGVVRHESVAVDTPDAIEMPWGVLWAFSFGKSISSSCVLAAFMLKAL